MAAMFYIPVSLATVSSGSAECPEWGGQRTGGSRAVTPDTRVRMIDKHRLQRAAWRPLKRMLVGPASGHSDTDF